MIFLLGLLKNWGLIFLVNKGMCFIIKTQTLFKIWIEAKQIHRVLEIKTEKHCPN